jgi:hypothetical protein
MPLLPALTFDAAMAEMVYQIGDRLHTDDTETTIVMAT